MLWIVVIAQVRIAQLEECPTCDWKGCEFGFQQERWEKFLLRNQQTKGVNSAQQTRFKTSLNLDVSYLYMYLLYHWPLGNQARCADVLLLITKPSATKWEYAIQATITALLYSFLKIIKISSSFQKYGWLIKVSDFVICEKKNTKKNPLPFQFFLGPKPKLFVPELTKAISGCVAHARKTKNMQICSHKCSAHVWKTKQKKFPRRTPLPQNCKPRRIKESKRMRRPFAKTFYVRGKAWPCLLVAHLPNGFQQKRDVSKCFQTFKKE